MLFALPAIVSQLEVNFVVFSHTLFYCEQDVSLLQSPRNPNAIVFYCEQDVSLLRSPRNPKATVFYCEQDVSLLQSPRNPKATVFYCEQDLSLLRTPTLSINTVAGNDSIQYPENTSPVTISGTITYIAPNTSITVNANGVNYFTTATYTDKYLTSFSVDIPSADILLWDTSEIITVSVTKNSIVYSATKVVTYNG